MFWIVLAVLIAVGWIFYSKRKGTVRLTKDQAELTLGLIHKGRVELEQKMHDVVDNGALQGQTVTVDSICKMTADMTEDVKREIERFKKELIYKYGPTIPVNTAHRISMALDGNGQIWTEQPGCYERHLQRRDGNPLFPPERRIVTYKEIKEGQQRDQLEQQQFKKKVDNFMSNTRDFLNLGQVTVEQSMSILKEVMELIEEGIAIGGNIAGGVERLASIEENVMQLINQANPEGADLIGKLHGLSCINRTPYMAQAFRKNSPILKGEEIPTILSEDPKTISLVGYMSRTAGPDSKPNEADIRNNLEKAVAQGFSKERAAQIIATWNEQ